VFDEEFDYLVTPLAYDVSLTVSVPYEWDVDSVYGIPVEEPFPHLLDLEIPTLFLSTRQGGGATLVRLRPGAMVDFSEESIIAEITLSYTTGDGAQETVPPVTALMPGGFDAEATVNYFENDSTKRAVLLLNTALVLRNACDDTYPDGDYYEYYWYDFDTTGMAQAINRLTEFLPYFDALAAGLENSASEASRTARSLRFVPSSVSSSERAGSCVGHQPRRTRSTEIAASKTVRAGRIVLPESETGISEVICTSPITRTARDGGPTSMRTLVSSSARPGSGALFESMRASRWV